MGEWASWSLQHDYYIKTTYPYHDTLEEAVKLNWGESTTVPIRNIL